MITTIKDSHSYRTDNRDLETTELHLDNEDKDIVTVFPFELVENAIENAIEDSDQCALFLERLSRLKIDISEI